jgi:hypothetical protein
MSVSQRGSGACALSLGSASHSRSGNDRSATGDVRRGARGAGRMQSRYDKGLRTGQWTCPARRPFREGGAAHRPESLPGWRALGAVAVRSRG